MKTGHEKNGTCSDAKSNEEYNQENDELNNQKSFKKFSFISFRRHRTEDGGNQRNFHQEHDNSDQNMTVTYFLYQPNDCNANECAKFKVFIGNHHARFIAGGT